MSIDEASECAALVLEMYSAVIRLDDQLQDPLPLDDQADTVPAFLVKSVS